MNFTDTHCHLADPAFRDMLPQVLQQAAQQGVRRFVVPAAQRGDWAEVLRLQQLPLMPHHGGKRADETERPSENGQPPYAPSGSLIRIALGIHPWFAAGADDADIAALEGLLREHPQALVGEIGLDFAKSRADEAPRQLELFCRQLELAQTLRRKAVVHNVKAGAAVAEAVKTCGFTQGGVIHAFSGSLEEAAVFVRLGFKIGIGSLLLNPVAKKARAAAQHLPIEAIVLETDSPFMLRGAVNTPARVRQIAETVAALRGIGLAELASQTERNADALLAG